MNWRQLAWLPLLLTCVFARPHTESIETVRSIAEAEEEHVSKKIRSVQWVVENEEEMSKGVFDYLGRTSRRRRSSFELHDWMTEGQKEHIHEMETSHKSSEDIKHKILEYFEDLSASEKDQWNEKYKDMCAAWVKTVASEEEIAELSSLRKHKDIATLHAKLAEYKTRLSDEEREKVELWKDVCSKLWSIEKKEASLHRLRRALAQYREYLHWLSPAQFSDLESMKEGGSSTEQIQAKVKLFFSELPGEQQKKLKVEFKAKCVSWLKDVASDHEIEQLKKLHEEGEDLEVQAKVGEYFARLSAPRQEEVGKVRALCKEAWGVSAPSRGRREIDAAYKEWIAWLTEDQKKEIETMRAGGSSFDDIHHKINDHFKGLDGETRDGLITQYKNKCKKYFKDMSTDDEVNRMKELYKVGEEHKVKEVIKSVIERQPEPKRTQALKLQKVCDEVYHKEGVHKHKRRDIDSLMHRHLNWLTPEQTVEIRDMKTDGKSTEQIKAKLLEFVSEMDEEKRKKVTEATTTSCYAWLNEAATPEEREELKQLHHRDHGACKTKVREYIQRLPADKQAAVNRNLAFCESIWYGSHGHSEHSHHHRRHLQTRRRRHHFTLENSLDTHLSWLTSEQQEELKEMKKEGKSKDELQAKIFHHYSDLHGEEKEKATEHLKAGCRDILKHVVGEEKAAELKAMKDSGASKEELKEKIDEMISHVTDEEKKHDIAHFGPACKRIYGIPQPRRRRHEITLENSLDTHLSWLTNEQKDELKAMKKEGKNKEEFQAKIFHHYSDLDGEEKEKATEHLKAGCREILRDVVGEEKAAELKAMKDSGASKEELKEKIDEMISHVTDEHNKHHIADFGPSCRRIYGIPQPRRRRHQVTLESSLDTHLSWLTHEQKEELKEMKKDGKNKDELQAKIFHHYSGLDGGEKEKATEHLKAGCREILKYVVGDEKAAELKAMKDSGVSKEELKEKVDEMVSHVTDEDKKKEIAHFGPVCKKIYGMESRHRRHHFNQVSSETMGQSLSRRRRSNFVQSMIDEFKFF